MIGQVIDNLNSVLNTVNSRGDDFTNMVNTLQQLVSGLAQDRQPIGNAISALGDLANSTANLLQQGRAPLRQDIASLGQVATNLNDNSGLLNTFLQNLPTKMNTIGSLASYRFVAEPLPVLGRHERGHQQRLARSRSAVTSRLRGADSEADEVR